MSADSIILSPHFDDAVLSCWHLLTGTGEVLVVNVFAGEPPAGVLGWWDRFAGASESAAAVRARIEEDRRALALAGRAHVNLPFLDSQYREADQAPAEIVEALRGVLVAGARIYAPASLGDGHCDHTAVRAAALALRAEGADVTLYADLPHATMLGWPRWVLNGGAPRARIGQPSNGLASSRRPGCHPGRWQSRPAGCARRTTPASSRRCLPMPARGGRSNGPSDPPWRILSCSALRSTGDCR